MAIHNKKLIKMMRCHATRSVAAKYLCDVTGCDLIARAITNIYAVNHKFVKCYSNKKRITVLEAPLEAQHNDVCSVFVAYTERKLLWFKI